MMRNFFCLLLLCGCLEDGTGRAPSVTPGFVPPGANPIPGGTAALEPQNLEFAFLPINSLRGQVAGYDAAANQCVTIVWDYSNNGQPMRKHCDDFFPSFPYVFVGAGGCSGEVHYIGNVEMVSARGCIDFAGFGGSSTDLVDVEIDVRGPAFTGTIRARN